MKKTIVVRTLTIITVARSLGAGINHANGTTQTTVPRKLPVARQSNRCLRLIIISCCQRREGSIPFKGACSHSPGRKQTDVFTPHAPCQREEKSCMLKMFSRFKLRTLQQPSLLAERRLPFWGSTHFSTFYLSSLSTHCVSSLAGARRCYKEWLLSPMAPGK